MAAHAAGQTPAMGTQQNLLPALEGIFLGLAAALCSMHLQ